MQLTISNNISWKEIDGLVVAVDLTTGVYFSLNSTASTIWRTLADHKSRDEARVAVEGAFETDGVDVTAAVEQCIAEWLDNGLLQQQNCP